jgi:CHAT domain-containing protein/Tfp pilus assembly protein PilF
LRKLFISLLIGLAAILLGYGQNTSDSARYLFNAYKQAKLLGDFERSELLLVQILENEYPISTYQNALVRNNLGFVYYETGRLSNALEQYRIAEELLTATDPATIHLRVSIHTNLDIYYKALGDYTSALEQNNEAVRLLNLIPRGDERALNKLSGLLLNKGISLFLLGKYDEALEVLKESAEFKRKYNQPYLGSVYFNLARIYQRLGNTEQSEHYFLLSIQQWSMEYDPDHYELGNIYLHFGDFLTARGKPEQGKEYLQKALQNYQHNYGNLHPLTASCYESLAKHSVELSKYEEAMDYMQQALNALSGEFAETDHFANPEPDASPHKLVLLGILATKANVLERSATAITSTDDKIKYLEAALATNLLSREVLHQVRTTFNSTESRIYLNYRQKDLFTTGIHLNLELYKLTGLQAYHEEAFITAAQGKSGELMFEMNTKEWLYLETLPDTTAIITTGLKQEMDQLSNMIRTEEMKMDADSAHLANWQEQLYHTRDSFNKQMEELRRDYPQLIQFESANMDFSIEQIRRNLRRKEALVEYFISDPEPSGKEEYYIFVVTKNECHVYRSAIDSAFYQNLAIITQNLHGFVPYLETSERFDSLKAALFGVYRMTIDPVRSYFRNKKLIIVPDEMLSYIPFDALITHLDSSSISNYAGAPYLLHEYDISYMYNSQLIEHQSPRTWRFPSVTAWLPGDATASRSGFGNLKGAVEEVQDILKLVKGRSVQMSMEKQDLVDILQERAILHLAMHSLATDISGSSPYFILDSVTDPLLANQMHDYEINALQLSTPMVVLSSCETAGGQLYRGEGIMSLSRSFMQAGAPSVVHSLWPVEDAKSREIMVGFYGELKKGIPKSSALSKVKRLYLDQQPPSYTHPYYWAAFQITGDTSPVYSKRNYFLIAGSMLLAFLIFAYFRRRSFFRRD